MDAETAIQTQIEPRLVGALGQLEANALLTRATLCYVMTAGAASKRFEAFVGSICSDERLIHVWGADGAQRQEQEWRALLTFFPSVEQSGTLNGEDL